MAVTFREFTGSDADYRLFAEIQNTVIVGYTTPDDLRLRERWWLPEENHSRAFIYKNGECIGTIHRNNGGEGEWTAYHDLEISILPAFRGQGHEKDIFIDAISVARQNAAKLVFTFVRDDDPAKMQIVRQLGFQQDLCYVISQLNLDLFDANRFDEPVRKVETEGIQIISASELSHKGIDWLRHLYDLMGMAPYRSFESFREQDSNPRHTFPECQLAAYSGDRCVGLTHLSHVSERPELAYCPFTVVDKEFQRRGIARALKVTCHRIAKELGLRSIVTQNMADSPMLHLNLQLEFQVQYSNCSFKKDIKLQEGEPSCP